MGLVVLLVHLSVVDSVCGSVSVPLAGGLTCVVAGGFC